MDEPIGTTIDGTPWEEPRGPHLPDALTRIARGVPPVSWAFVAMAVVNGLVLGSDRATVLLYSPGLDLATYVRSIVGLVLAIISPVATTLFGAAFFARHPGGWTTHRSIAVGVTLIAIGEVMHTATRHLGDFFRALTPPLDDMMIVAPSEVAYTILATILIAVGTFSIARGLRAAFLRADDADGSRARYFVTVVIALLAVWSIVMSVLAVSQYSSPDTNSIYIAQAVLLMVVGWFPLAAQSYLAMVAVTGLAAGERPASVWWLTSAGILTILLFGNGLAVAVDTVAYAVVTPTTDFAIWTWIYLVPAVGWALGYLLLLAAFVRGLPSVHASDVDVAAPDLGGDTRPR